MNREAPIRLPSEAEINRFHRDGAICLRGVLDPAFVLAMQSPVDRLLVSDEFGMTNMSAVASDIEQSGEKVLRDDSISGGRFISGVDHWRLDPVFADFACSRSIAVVVAALLRSNKINLWEDSVLVKEAGTAEGTAWHQDMSYFHVTGEQLCTTWIPLDIADADSGAMSFVRGSHRWPDVYKPNWFVSRMSLPDTEGDSVPDIDSMIASQDIELLQFDLGPGDLTVHHARTLHSAGPNRSSHTRRAISLRYCGDDVRYHLRKGVPRKAHHEFVRDGDILDCQECPVVWQGN